VMAGDFEQVSASFTGVAAGSNLRIATSSKRAFIDDVEIICDETQEEGCLDSTYGQYPSNTYTPYCIGVTEEITTEGYAGEYSKVNLTAGVEYTFSSSVSTDYITISDTNGTVVLISGTTPVVYTPSANEEVRFYTHVDEDCTPEASLRARMVQCGEPVIVDEPDYDCFQGDGIPLSIDDGFAIHNPSNFMVADDFVVDPGTQFTIHQITVDVNQPEIPSTATLNIREDNGGVPGAVVGTATMAPSEAILYGVAYQDPVYHLVFDLDTPIVLPEGTYYLQTQMSVPSATVVWWVVTESGTTGNPALVSYDNGASWEVFDSAYDMAFFVAGDCEPVSSEDDCDQGDDSAGDDVTVALQIGTGTDFSHADDFFVSPGNTLNVKQIELNYVTLNGMPADSWTFTFYEDDGGLPGSVEVASVSPTEFTQVQIGIMFGAYPLYAVFAEVDLNFTEGHYWMMPVAQAANGDTGSVFWETTPFGTLGEIIAEFDATVGNWVHYADEDVQGVFKLHCEPVDPPEEQCLFDITISVEPITRVVLSDIDNTSSAVVNGSPALEDFTSIVGHLAPGTTYEVALEGNTDGAYTNYFTLWIDFDQSGTYDSNEMFEIGSIYNSTGQDGQQAVNTIQIPSDAPLGTTTMRVIKNFSTSPTNPCGQYSFGQGEDYTIEIVELEDCSGTPEGGTVTVNPETGNPGSTYTVSASGYSIGNGLSYQWQSNTNGEGWVNEGAASSEYASYIATAPEEVGDEVEWRLEVTCTLSGETALSTIAIFTVEKVYCHPDIVFVEPITRVLLANIDNYSAADSTEPYEDFTSIVGNLTRTLDYEIALEGNTAGPYTNYFTVWIDWNQNGSFESTEMYEIGSIYNSTGEDGQQAVNTIDVPEDALLGITRMRVIKNYSVSPTDPCGNYTFGQVEDYSINVESLGTSDMDINAFAYWPNPTRGVLNIESQKEIKSVEILNLAGQKVMADQKVIDGQINVSQLTSATYVFRVNFADGTIRTFKILKK